MADDKYTVVATISLRSQPELVEALFAELNKHGYLTRAKKIVISLEVGEMNAASTEADLYEIIENSPAVWQEDSPVELRTKRHAPTLKTDKTSKEETPMERYISQIGGEYDT